MREKCRIAGEPIGKDREPIGKDIVLGLEVVSCIREALEGKAPAGYFGGGTLVYIRQVTMVGLRR
jgi:hypothetical protein